MQINFGYPWWLTYGHLIVAAIAVALLALAISLKGPRWTKWLSGALAVWAVAASLVMLFPLNVNAKASLPTPSFLTSGAGRVLDLGAGTGRSSIMVLESRPQATLVALDLFSESFDMHFGRGDTPQQRLLANLKAAGVEQRTTIQTGDMRKLPFDNAAFDAVVSSYAIDHLNRDGITQTLAETARVLKPGGDFLMMVVNKDPWLQFTFGPMLLHSGLRGPAWWTDKVKAAGFQVIETGTPPATVYVLARRP
ncbi:MAG: class I SAM-dependent methyltransferase [Bryobacteraceae bacterium]